MKIRKYLTGSRIETMYIIYSAIKDAFEENETDELDEEYLFSYIMQKGKGSLNPRKVKEELINIYGGCKQGA